MSRSQSNIGLGAVLAALLALVVVALAQNAKTPEGELTDLRNVTAAVMIESDNAAQYQQLLVSFVDQASSLVRQSKPTAAAAQMKSFSSSVQSLRTQGMLGKETADDLLARAKRVTVLLGEK